MYRLIGLLLLTTLGGCADGPMPTFMSLNPQMRRQWEADELYQPTLHRQLAEVDAVRESASTLSAAQQRHWCEEFQYILQTHDNPLLRAAAVDALAEFAVPESQEGLRIALKDGDPLVRQAACGAWGKRGGRHAIQLLAETLGSDTDLDVRIRAARELGHFQDAMAYQALGLALQDRDPALQYRAVESLRSASGKDYGSDLDAWQRFAQGQNPGPEHHATLAERFYELF